MTYNITGRNMEITDSLRNRIEKKIAKLDRLLRDRQEVHVRLSQEKATRNTVEITIPMGGSILRVEETTDNMYASIDNAVDKIIRQIRRYRTRLEKRLRDNAFTPEEIAEEVAEEPMKVVRTKRFALKPVSVEDAIRQMEMLGHTFFLFLNADTDIISVVYKRNDGNYGLIEPTNG
ncbi:MAG: ribosome hibernation-promoting factor, HPF/YfiA family [Christensenellales bacterium]|jgi:putative sigma-54 modulation protein